MPNRVKHYGNHKRRGHRPTEQRPQIGMREDIEKYVKHGCKKPHAQNRQKRYYADDIEYLIRAVEKLRNLICEVSDMFEKGTE